MAKRLRMPLVAMLLTFVWILFGSPNTATAGPSCGEYEGSFESHDPIYGYGHPYCSGSYCPWGERYWCQTGINNCYWRCVIVDGQMQIQDVTCLQVFYGCPQPHPTCIICGG